MSVMYVISDNLDMIPELVSGAKTLADSVTAIMFGCEKCAAKAAAAGADKVIYCPTDEKTAPESWAKAIAAEIKTQEKAAVLVSNTIRGREIAAKIGVYLDCGVFTNANGFTYNDGVLECSRTVYGGAAASKLASKGAYAVATVNGGTFETAEYSATTDIAAIGGEADTRVTVVGDTEKQEVSVNLAVAKRIVDVGRGLAKEEDLEMMRNLASKIGGELGCSRPVAENNKWMPKACYMGITGVAVKPDIILVCGVSGQIQHLGGIGKSKTIVAINKDKNAPIFKNCDFGLVGDMYKIIPALIEKL